MGVTCETNFAYVCNLSCLSMPFTSPEFASSSIIPQPTCQCLQCRSPSLPQTLLLQQMLSKAWDFHLAGGPLCLRFSGASQVYGRFLGTLSVEEI